MRNEHLQRYMLPLWQGMVELLFYSPIWLTLAIYYIPSSVIPLWVGMLIISYVLPHHIAKHKANMRNAHRILLDVVLGLSPVLLIAAGSNMSILGIVLCGAAGIAYVESSFRSISWGWKDSFSAPLMIVMMMSAVVLQILKVVVLHNVVQYNELLTVLGIAAVILFLYIQNERTITNQKMIQESSPTIKRSVVMNRWYITTVSLLVISISLFRSFQKVIENWIEGLLAAFFAWLLRDRGEEQQQPIEQPTPQNNPMEGIGEQQEPSLFWALLELIFKWIASIAIIVLAAVIVYYIIRKVLPFILQAIAKLLGNNLKFKKQVQGYTDQIEQLKPERNEEKFAAKKQKKQQPLKKWDSMSAAQKVRALYQAAMLGGFSKGAAVSSRKTAKENLNLLMNDEETTLLYTNLLNSYNETRYGHVEPELEGVELMRKQIEMKANKK